jgi:UDP-N-acetylmuramoyl-L-alanyl-D-glutamate--2,6-diaminopimelate ligase
MKFVKYHGIGNDYIVMMAEELNLPLTPTRIQRICDRNLGPGSDGIVLVESHTAQGFIVRIFNPDGSEAENSGNGMRIVSRFLFDRGLVGKEPFTLLAKGERRLTAQIRDSQHAITVDMGKANFLSTEIPVAGALREVIGEKLELLGEELTINCVSVGNPHCVIIGRPDIKDGALRLGPYIEVHERFPRRTNVQFVHVIDRSSIRIEIWERGAGYTLASGSSASAAASVCRKLGLVDSRITVHMPGGLLQITVAEDYTVTLTGPITRICEGTIDSEIFEWGLNQTNTRSVALAELIAPESHAISTHHILERASADGVRVTGVASDSRTVKEGDVFFAMSGAKHDARLLVNEAFDRGARVVVYEGELPVPPKGLVVPVVDIRRALSYAAHVFYGRPSLVTTNIGITGTSGKTSVAWMLSHALHILGKRTYLGGTLGYTTLEPGDGPDALPRVDLRELGNTTIDPITVHRLMAEALHSGVQAAVFEATSQGVVQRRMRDVAWDGVLFTNLSRDHMDLHGTMEAYEAAKSELFTTDLAASPKAGRFAVINIDDAAGARIAATISEQYPQIRVASLALAGSSSGSATYTAHDLQASVTGLSFRLSGRGESIDIKTPAIGTHNIYNAGCVAVALRELGYSPAQIEQTFAAIPAVPGRLEPVMGARVPVFVDYAHKPDALDKVLRFLRPVCTGRLISVFGCGGERDVGKRPIMGELSHRLADVTVVTSDNPRSEEPQSIVDAIVKGIPNSAHAIQSGSLVVEVDRRKAIKFALSIAQSGDVVLIAGKGHEPYQEINGIKHPFSDRAVAQESLAGLA